MWPGALVGGDVVELTSRVTVAGVTRAHTSWSVDRDLQGDLPEQVVAVSGFKQATGKVSWKEAPDVSDREANPWNKNGQWFPAQGERVVIYAGDGVSEWLQFVGVIDETTGSVGSGFESSIVDYVDFLNRVVEHETVLRLHPPKVEGGDYMGVGMTPYYAVDRAARACGLYATPGMEPGIVLSVPCQTSMWPEWGNITSAGALNTTGPATHADNRRAPWGWCVSDFTATYTPQGTVARTDAVQLTAMVAPDHTGSFTFDAYYGTLKVRLWINTGRAAVAFLDGTEVCRIGLGAATIVTLKVKSGVWTIKTNTGGTISGTMALPAGAGMSSISITGDDNARVAGLMISKPSTDNEFSSMDHVSTFYQETALFTGLSDVMPSYSNTPAVDLITEISKATLAPFWFDERGALRMIGSDVLRSQASAQTITTEDDIFALQWKDSRLGMRSRVRVKYKYPAINRSRYSRVRLWQGSGETVDSSDELSLFASAETDVDWAEIDHGFVSAGGLSVFNQGRGTWVGGMLEDAAGVQSDGSPYYSCTINTVDPRTRRFDITIGTLPAGRKMILTAPDSTSYFPRWRGISLPILRGRARVEWKEMTLASATTGPYGFPEVEHDAGPWGVQVKNTLIQQRIADFIADQVTKPAPTITGLSVAFDPRRQLGDVITIDSPNLMGIQIKALVVGVKSDAADSFKQSLTVRIITASTLYKTYAEYNDSLPAAPLTYAQWQALGPLPQTYAQFNDAA